MRRHVSAVSVDGPLLLAAVPGRGMAGAAGPPPCQALGVTRIALDTMASWILALGIVALVGYVINALFPQPSLRELVRAARTSASPSDELARQPIARQGESPLAPPARPIATSPP